MTYFGFLAIFVIVPILVLWFIALRDARSGLRLPTQMQAWGSWIAIAIHVVIAVIYTTPWDNYLVATGVWWYQKSLVTGLIIGFVPIEEYCFFVLQVLLTGLWLLMLARHSPVSTQSNPSNHLRWILTLTIFVVWLIFVGILITGWKPGTYLGLLMVWALPPIMLQTAFGADILWRHRKLVLLSIIPMTLYLAAADKLAISSGTWTIDPQQSLQSLGVLILGKLPLEELTFFLMTNTLITLGCILMLDTESKARGIHYLTGIREYVATRRKRRIAQYR
jgi:lycopene cyclase domain-containing protein